MSTKGKLYVGLTPKDIMHHVQIPGAGHRDRLRETRGVRRHETMQTLAHHDGWNSQAGLLTEEFLEGADEARRFRRLHAFIRKRGYGKYLAHAVPDEFSGFLLREIALVISSGSFEIRQTLCLPNFFFQGHPAEQVSDALLYGESRVAVGWLITRRLRQYPFRETGEYDDSEADEAQGQACFHSHASTPCCRQKPISLFGSPWARGG